MATIYTAPKEITLPQLDFSDMKGYNEKSEKYIKDLKQLLIDRCVKGGKDTKNVGESIYFPVADGSAEYMVACMKPLQLIHIELGDSYVFQYANLLKAKDVQEKIDNQKAISKIFPPRK